ncbi:MAG TPA: MarR family winged helix-turn-helix transcriptional regulator [Acidimicrobiales bacterium]|nr:MarR family winged helix-turn-helix transcriptional regulator [Acidimicrobiales bacterium]
MAIRAVGPQEVVGRQPVVPVAATSRIRSGDELASQLLLTFVRLLGPRRQGGAMPKHVKAMLNGGCLAPRHLRAFAVVTLAGPMTVSELARQEGLALSTASLLVTQLAEAGLVERHEDAADRRRTVVSVAPEHRRESRAVLESKLAPLRRALDRMGPRQARALFEGLDILLEEVGRTRGGAGDGADGDGDGTEEPR